MLQAGDPGWVPNRNSAALQTSVAGGGDSGDSSSSGKDNLAVSGLADTNNGSGNGGGDGNNSEELHDLKAAVSDIQANLKELMQRE